MWKGRKEEKKERERGRERERETGREGEEGKEGGRKGRRNERKSTVYFISTLKLHLYLNPELSILSRRCSFSSNTEFFMMMLSSGSIIRKVNILS